MEKVPHYKSGNYYSVSCGNIFQSSSVQMALLYLTLDGSSVNGLHSGFRKPRWGFQMAYLR